MAESTRTRTTHATSNGGPPASEAAGEERAKRSGGTGGGGILAKLASPLLSRIPQADLDERDPDYIRETLPGLWMLATLYFRADVRGLHNIPEEGGVLLVGNHSGGNLTPDTHVFTLAFTTYFGVERRFHQLAHNLVLAFPGLSMLRKYGTVAASHENAHKALASGAALLVYPGGDYEVHRPTWEQTKIDWNGRKGYVRLALEEDVPIVPIVAIGGQETALFLSRGRRLAKLLQLDKMFRLKVLPINIGPPWGLNVGDMTGRIPFPAKITVEALPPIYLREQFGDDPDIAAIDRHVRGEMQTKLDELAAERRFPLLG